MRLREALRVSEQRGDMFRVHALSRELLFPTADATLFSLPRRHKLLQLRLQEPHRFSTPVPLLEMDIVDDKVRAQRGVGMRARGRWLSGVLS